VLVSKASTVLLPPRGFDSYRLERPLPGRICTY
jgi:hypothetical protein